MSAHLGSSKSTKLQSLDPLALANDGTEKELINAAESPLPPKVDLYLDRAVLADPIAEEVCVCERQTPGVVPPVPRPAEHDTSSASASTASSSAAGSAVSLSSKPKRARARAGVEPAGANGRESAEESEPANVQEATDAQPQPRAARKVKAAKEA